MNETPSARRVRIRWGWFIGCIVLGLAAILIGAFVSPATSQSGYIAEKQAETRRLTDEFTKRIVDNATDEG